MEWGVSALLIIWSLLILSGIFLGLRVYCRLQAAGKLWWDDWVMIASFICACSERVVVSFAIRRGFGKHMFEVDQADLSMLPFLTHVAAGFSILSCMLAKTSWTLTMLRIVRASRDCMRIIVWFMLVSINVLMGVGIILNFMACDGGGLTASPLDEKCWTNIVAVKYNIFSAVWSSTTDIALALLAWVIILPMQIATKDKFAVVVGMSLGIVSAAIGFEKTAQIFNMAKTDATYELTILMIWSTAEVCSLTMAASVPFIRFFVGAKLSASKKNNSGRHELVGRSHDKAFTSTSTTTRRCSQTDWQAQSGDSGLVGDGPGTGSLDANDGTSKTHQ